MILQTWNLSRGDASTLLEPTVAAIRGHGADVVVLTGYRPAPMAPLRQALAEVGWTCYLDSAPPGGAASGLAVLGRGGEPLVPTGELYLRHPHRWFEVLVPVPFLRVLAVHVPSGGGAKAPFWEAVIRYAQERQGDPGVILGDFAMDEVEGLAFKYPVYIQALRDLGWIEAYRHFHPWSSDPTWVEAGGRGARVDRAFVSAGAMPRLERAWHSHAERENGCSDHASLLIELT